MSSKKFVRKSVNVVNIRGLQYFFKFFFYKIYVIEEKIMKKKNVGNEEGK